MERVDESCRASRGISLLHASARMVSASRTSASLLVSSVCSTRTCRCSWAISTCCCLKALPKLPCTVLLLPELTGEGAMFLWSPFLLPVELLNFVLLLGSLLLLLAADAWTWHSGHGCCCQMSSSCRAYCSCSSRDTFSSLSRSNSLQASAINLLWMEQWYTLDAVHQLAGRELFQEDSLLSSTFLRVTR